MKKIILTCSPPYGPYGAQVPDERFIIEIDESTGDAQIVNARAAYIERDRSASLDIGGGITLSVEAA